MAVTVEPSARRIVTVLPASALPVRTLPSALKVPVGAVGAVVSTIIVVTADATLVLPAASVAVAVKLCVPCVNVVVVCGRVQLPLPSAVTVPTSVMPS